VAFVVLGTLYVGRSMYSVLMYQSHPVAGLDYYVVSYPSAHTQVGIMASMETTVRVILPSRPITLTYQNVEYGK